MAAGEYSHRELHEHLIRKWYRGDGTEGNQAEFCPYYVKLQGELGFDWGIIVNPESAKFGDLVFEHDACGCPDHCSCPQKLDTWQVE